MIWLLVLPLLLLLGLMLFGLIVVSQVGSAGGHRDYGIGTTIRLFGWVMVIAGSAGAVSLIAVLWKFH